MSRNPYLGQELKHFLYTFKRQPLLLTRAKGAWVWDEKGKKYLDFFSGLAVCGVGHNEEHVVKAIRDQAGKILHSSNFFYTKPQSEFAKRLTGRWKGSRVFLSNSGAEANELAIKLARLWATRNNKRGRTIITFENAFHGRTLATTTASWGRTRNNDVFEPLPKGFVSSPFNDLAALQRRVDASTIAVMLEPVQGEGGINIASKEFMRGIGALCKKRKLLLILDEVQSGMGRTGTFFAFEQYGVQPDIVTLAKGLAGGVPLAATLSQPRVADLMAPGLHGSTFGGNPVSCAAALEVLKLLTPRALRHIRQTGKYLSTRLSAFRRFRVVKEIRGFGLMQAIELHEAGDSYVEFARQKGVLINCTQGKVLRFLPPYFISKSELDKCISILEEMFASLESEKI